MIYIKNNHADLTGTDNELINDLACIIKTLEINNKLYLLEQGKNLAPVKVVKEHKETL